MKRVLFVDARNTARSRMAEALFNHLAGDSMRAASCGTMPSYKSDVLVAKVVKELGIDFPYRLPRSVTQQILAEADIVVLMGRDVYPRAFAPKAIWDFRDPTGASLSSYRDLRDAIRLNVLKLIAEIRRSQHDAHGAHPPLADSVLSG